MHLPEMILRKLGLRSDTIWASKFLYRDPIRRLPLFLDTWVLMKSQYWPRARIDALADMRLRDILRRTKHIPLFSERYAAAGIETGNCTRVQFEKLPFLTKKDFFENELDRFTDKTLISKSHVDHTSGSTGKPLEFYLDWRAELRYFAIRDRMFQTIAGGEKLPVVYFRSRINPGFFFGRHILFFLRGYNDIRHRLDAFIQEVRTLKQDFILYGYVSQMTELARRVSERGERLRLRAIVATGENLREPDRDYIEKHLHTKFFLTYATWEVKWVAHECLEHRLHINEEYAYVEIVDDSGKVLPAGNEGQIVVTSFDSESMPFIRYAVGDRGVVSEEPCACGKTSRTLKLFGRQSDIIELADNRVVPLFDVSTAFDEFSEAVRQYRIIQTSSLQFRIQVLAGPKFSEDEERLGMRLVSILHPRAVIEWEVVDFIPQAENAKMKYFIRAM